MGGPGHRRGHCRGSALGDDTLQRSSAAVARQSSQPAFAMPPRRHVLTPDRTCAPQFNSTALIDLQFTLLINRAAAARIAKASPAPPSARLHRLCKARPQPSKQVQLSQVTGGRIRRILPQLNLHHPPLSHRVSRHSQRDRPIRSEFALVSYAAPPM